MKKISYYLSGSLISLALWAGASVYAEGTTSEISLPQEVNSATVEVSTTLWNGEQRVEGWSGAQQFSASDCAGIKAGDKIVVTCTEALSTSQSQVDIRNGKGWANFSPALNINITNQTFPYDAVFTVTDEVADIIHANGMVVTGKDFVFTRVAVTSSIETTDPSEKGNYTRTVWSGNEAISWISGKNNSVLISNATLGTLRPGDIVRVYYTDMKPGAVGRILANWTALKSITNATLLGGRFYEYTLTQEWIDQLSVSTGLRISGNNYTATKVEIIDPSKKYLVKGEVDMQDIRAWEAGEQPKVSVSVSNLESIPVDVLVEVDIDHDSYGKYTGEQRALTLDAGASTRLDIPFDLEAGFYNLNVYVNGDNVCSRVIGSRPTEVVSTPDDNIEEIKSYWQKELEILSDIPLDAELTLIESASTANRNVYLVKMKSTPDTYGGEPVEIRGFYAEPVAPGKYPALIQYQGTDGGTSTIRPIGGDDNIGWCELVLSTRGQMLNNRNPELCEWAWLDPNYTRKENGSIDYYAHGFGSLEKHYYRGANIDCVRAIDFIESREKVHKDNIFCVGGSQGGSFVYMAAALGSGRIRAAAPSITGHSDFRDCVRIVSWPGNVFASSQAELGMTDDDMWHFLSFFDVKNIAPMVKCPVITSLSLQDRTDPPHINVAPFNNIDRSNLTDDDLQYVVNPFLGHASASDWKSRYMAFFEKYRTDIEPFDPTTPVITVWEGSEKINWNSGPENNYVAIPSSQFKNAAAGSRLRVCFTDLTLNAQGHVCQGNWSDLPDATEYLPLTGSSYEYTITENMLAKLKANGMVVTGVGYTLSCVEIVNHDNLPDISSKINESSISVWTGDDTPVISVGLTENSGKDSEVEVILDLRTDSFNPLQPLSRKVTVPAHETVDVKFDLKGLVPGFYHAVVTANHSELGDFNFGYDLENIVSEPDMQPEFNQFWEDALTRLQSVPMETKLTLVPEKSTDQRNVYLVEINSVPDELSSTPVIIRGYYAEPVADGKYPVLITYQGYDSDASSTPWCPGGNDRPGYIELVLSTRGQMVNNRPPYTNLYGDWFLSGFGSEDTFYYLGAYMDAVRAVDFVESRSKCDSENIFAQGQSQGGALTIAAAALSNGRIKAIAPSIPFMGDFPDYFRVGNWPSYNAFKKQSEMGLSDEDMYRFLSYFDTKNLATMVSCPVKTAIGLQDNVCPPHTNVAPYNNFATQIKEITVNPLLKHQTHSTWDREFMEFFQRNYSGIESIGVENISLNDSVVTVYDLSGIKVFEGTEISDSTLDPGVYIVKHKGETRKIMIR